MRGKRAAIIAVAAAVALFTGGTAARCAAMVAAGDGAAGQQENAQERGEDGRGLPDGEAAPPGAQDLLARLGSAPWSDATGSIVLEFGDGTWIGNTYLDGFDRISPAFLNSTGLM